MLHSHSIQSAKEERSYQINFHFLWQGKVLHGVRSHGEWRGRGSAVREASLAFSLPGAVSAPAHSLVGTTRSPSPRTFPRLGRCPGGGRSRGPAELAGALRGAAWVNTLCISRYHPAVCRQCRFSKDLMNKQPASAGGVIYIVNAYMCIINMHLYGFR